MSADEPQRVPAAHPALAGHFPGNPVVPAVLILERVVASAPGPVTGVRSAKFLRPLAPDTAFHVRGREVEPGRWRFSVNGADGNELARGELALEAR